MSKRMIVTVAFLTALILTSYPFLLRLLYQQEAQESISRFQQEIENPSPAAPVAEQPTEPPTQALTEQRTEASLPSGPVCPELREAMEQYNRTILETEQRDLDSVDGYETPAVDVSAYLDTDAIGVIYVPAMDIQLPLYLGASKPNMAKGAVVLGGSSCPVGGRDTNCVIAAHRGYSGIPYFREIERLKVGDFVFITNPWETLTYAVRDIKIVTPDSLELVHIQPGKDMVTLVTCHPYRVGTQRYLVFCDRLEQPEETVNASSATDSEPVGEVSEMPGIDSHQDKTDDMDASEPLLTDESWQETEMESLLELVSLVLVVTIGGWLVVNTWRKQS